MNYASIGPISIHFPDRLETNEDLRAECPNWNMEAIYEKTGIAARYVCDENECASDLAVKAAEKLFEENDIDRNSIDFLLFCTQTPDYPLPTTACLLQDRLGLPTSMGALDFNLGCSGYVYGLSLADGLIRSGVAKRVLFLTGETYSKYIDAKDRSLRTIFGDAATATLIEAKPEQTLSSFRFGTDGTGANTLIVNQGGSRPPEDAIQPRGKQRWKSKLYMDGPSLINFTVGAIPKVVQSICDGDNLTQEEIKLFIFHQATRKLLGMLQERLGLDDTRLPVELDNYGNTCGCTVPILINDLRKAGRIEVGTPNLLMGFGVGWSWAGCIWRDSFGN